MPYVGGRNRSRSGSFRLAGLLALALATAARAQITSGNVYGRVVQEGAGGALPAAVVTLTGIGAEQTALSDARGRFHFLRLAPGVYALDARLDGFGSARLEEVEVRLGHNTAVEIPLRPAIGETITVTSETAPLERRRVASGADFNRQELDAIPTARDVWDTVRQTPGVLIDRIAGAGDQSSLQSPVVGPGAGVDQNAWAIDGVVVTEPLNTGFSALFFDFDSVAALEVTTGGGDISLATGGVTTNLVTKRGTSEWRGSAHLFATGGGLQSGLDFDRGDLAEPGPWNLGNAQASFRQADRVEDLSDFGAEIGGPLRARRLWLWGAYGQQDSDVRTLGDFHEVAVVRTSTLKLDAQLAAGDSLQLFALRSDGLRQGRDVGPLRPPETAWDFPGVVSIAKVESSHLLGRKAYLHPTLSAVDEDLEFIAPGGTAVNAVNDVSGVWRHSFLSGTTERPQEGVRLAAGLLAGAGAAQHEVLLGAGQRRAHHRSRGFWPGAGGVIGLASAVNTLGVPLAVATLGSDSGDERDVFTFYARDTWSRGRLTLDLGVRYDLQDGRHLPSSLAANELFPALLPGRDVAAGDAGFQWESLAPRIGLTRAFGKAGGTVLRASWSRFASELSLADVGHANPNRAFTNGSAGTVTFIWLDDGDQLFDPAEVGPIVALSTDPARPGLAPNAVDPELDAPLTDELLVAVERAFTPRLTAAVTLTWRRRSDLRERERLVFDAGLPRLGAGRVHAAGDYAEAFRLTGVLPDGSAYDEPVWALRHDRLFFGGTWLTNGASEQGYLGATLSFQRRPGRRFSLRGWIQLYDWEWSVPAGAVEDPTLEVLGTTDDGGAVIQNSLEAGGVAPAVYLNSRWSFDLFGLVHLGPQRRWGFDVAFDLYGREGHPLPYFQTLPGAATGDGIDRRVLLAGSVDRFRNDDVVSLNASLAKRFAVGRGGLVVSLEAFNLLDRATVLQRQNELGLAVGDHVLEVMSPRIFRLGLRLELH